MLTKFLPSLRQCGLIAASAALLGACVSPVPGASGNYTSSIGGAPVTANPTPYSQALVCMGSYVRANDIIAPRIAVGRVLDYTGKADFEGGRKITQGASLMAISAFAKAGARLVERFDTSVSELELKYANNKLIGDDEPTSNFRQIMAGSIPGSDFYLVGGITELNAGIRSTGVDGFIGDVDPTDARGNFGVKLYVVNVGLDLRLVHTQTLEVVDVISYQKQIIGRELSAGIFDFANNNIFDIGAGERAQEPMQLAVRSVVERAVLEMTANLYGASGPDVCDQLVTDNARTHSSTGDFLATSDDTLTTNNGHSRGDAWRWHENSLNGDTSTLRGRF